MLNCILIGIFGLRHLQVIFRDGSFPKLKVKWKIRSERKFIYLHMM